MENYERDNHRRKFDYLHAKLIDIDRALRLLRVLQPKAYTAVLLLGLIGLAQETAATLAGTSRRTLVRRYDHALTVMAQYLNQGRYH